MVMCVMCFWRILLFCNMSNDLVLIWLYNRLIMSSFNPLTSIPNQNKLKGPNYVDWKHNLDIVLTTEGFKFVLVKECPVKLDEPTDDEIKAYEKWVKAAEMARCYILASMENVLQHQHQSMTTAYNILKFLK